MRIEANILQTCNAACAHCNKAVSYADARTSKLNRPLLPTMTLEQIRKAVDQLISQRINVSRFTFCGGEPIMHPQLQEMVYEVARLKTLAWGRLLTNGLPGTLAKREAIDLPPRFSWIINPLDNPDDPMSGKNDPSKRGNGRTHSPFWISPADLGIEAKFENCTVRTWCGAGLDADGWSMCGKAVMFGKLLGVTDVAIMEGDIEAHVEKPILEICKHCQYGLGGEKKRLTRNGPFVNLKAHAINERYKAGELPAVSDTFRRAFDQFNESGLVPLEEIVE